MPTYVCAQWRAALPCSVPSPLYEQPTRAARRIAQTARLLAIGWMVIAALTLSAGARAEDPSRAALPDPLTLDIAVREALDYNYEVRQAAVRVRQRSGEAAHAGRPVPDNPVLQIEAGRREAPDDTSTDIGISVSQALWTGGKRGSGRAAADARIKAAREELDYLRTSVAARTRRAYLQVLLAHEAARTAQRLVELTREVASFARRRLEAGEATEMEVNVATIGVGRARSELAQAQRDRARARLTLAELLALDPRHELRVTGRLKPVALELPERDALLQRSLERRRDLAAAARTMVAAREELKLADRQAIPNLTVTGFYNREESADIAGIGLSLPLPLLHRYSGEQQAADARLARARLKRDALQQQVRREVLEAVADYRAAREQVEVLGGNTLGAAEKNLHLTRIAFQAGKVGAPAITSAQDNLLDVRRTYLNALDELITAGTALERATGGLIRMAQGAGPNDEEHNQ